MFALAFCVCFCVADIPLPMFVPAKRSPETDGMGGDAAGKEAGMEDGMGVVAGVGSIGPKREIAVRARQEGLSTRDLILIAVLIAAGAVLKLTVSSFLNFAGMKPNFMIAMYCLAIVLTRPKIHQAAIIGLLVGLVSQIPLLNATPLVNIVSEMLGALACGALMAALSKVASENGAFQNVVAPTVAAFVSTVVSGYAFALIVGAVVAGLEPLAVFGVYAVMVFGTAAMNAVLMAVLSPVLHVVLKR